MPIALDDAHRERAIHRRDIHWLVWDLQLGIDSPADAARYLDPIDDVIRSRIRDLALQDRLVAGLDAYPVSIDPLGDDAAVNGASSWMVQDRIDIIMEQIRDWHARYQQPFWIAETSNLSLDVSDQIPWLDAMHAGLQSLAGDGLPARGLCWYSRGDQFDWQTALANPTGAVTEVGLFDADRQARPVAARFKELASR